VQKHVDNAIAGRFARLRKIFGSEYRISRTGPIDGGATQYLAIAFGVRVIIFPRRVVEVGPILENSFLAKTARGAATDGLFDPGRVSDIQGVEVFHLGMPAAPPKIWPELGEAGEPVDVVFLPQKDTDIAFFVPRRGGSHGTIVAKLPHEPAATAACSHEFDVLGQLEQDREGIAPRPIRAGHYTVGSFALRYFCQSFVAGEHPDPADNDSLCDFLGRLRLPGQTVSLRRLADDLRPRVAALAVPDRSRERLLALLRRVCDERELPASIGHGDWWGRNMIRTPEGRLVGLDWEFSRTPWLGFLDLAQAGFIRDYLSRSRASLAEIHSPRKVRTIRTVGSRLSGHALPDMDQVLALHFCQHYVDRVEALGGLRSDGLRHLDRLLLGPWPDRTA